VVRVTGKEFMSSDDRTRRSSLIRVLPDSGWRRRLAVRRDDGAPCGGHIAIVFGVRDQLSDELVDELLAGRAASRRSLGPGGLLAGLTKRLVDPARRSS